ncbi:MAG TPA: class I SAM-dependent methyltransferase [Steroidobacteraceae bacterium]|jgi:predicted O-methyltransferase YrrM
MNTLTTSPLPELLSRLFADADASDAEMRKQRANATPEEIARRAQSSDYRAFYALAKDYHLAVSPETGSLLYMLARSMGARTIIEFGTSFGISTLHLAAALKDNGGGRLIGSEFEPGKVKHAQENLRAGNLHEFVEVREGDALETLARDLPPSIDLVLLDGAKPLYPKVLDLLEPRLRGGALIVADNADWCPEYLARVRNPANGYLSVAFAGDVELSMRLSGGSTGTYA